MLDRMKFGSTGHTSSRVIFGAAALGSMSQERADTTLDILLQRGINHIDTAATYGESELRLAPFLQDHRPEFFLATKTDQRTGGGARAGLESSLERMGVDRVDLIQLHNLVEEDDWRTAFSSGGAVEALFRARDEGLCGEVGVTGHGLRIAGMHVRSLAEAPFASVQLPWNHTLAEFDDYSDDFRRLRALCVERGVAIQTIKSIARRRWDDFSQMQYSWYEPISQPDILARAVRFVLADPNLFLNSSSDARLLEMALDAAVDLGEPPDPDQLASDRSDHMMMPLFDGRELETI